MKHTRKSWRGGSERGIALLIAIFVLLLISVVAIALLVSSGTETALGANYRASSTVYYGAMAGLEEVRGRLLPKNPDYLGAGYVPPGTPLQLGHPLYITNALTGETVDPVDPSNPYYDKEYKQEFSVEASTTGATSLSSVWSNNAKGIPGPVYKWVRITAATEQSLFLDVDSSGGALDNSTPIYYDLGASPNPTLVRISGAPVSPTQVQALQITAFAALPNGTQKYLQYLVAPVGQNGLAFPAALTLDGPNVGQGSSLFYLPFGSTFLMDGRDLNYNLTSGGCSPGSNSSPSPVWAIAYSNNDLSQGNITSAIGANHGSYKGVPALNPDVASSAPTLPANMQSVAGLNSLVATISQQADVTLPGGSVQSDSNNLMPAAMSATNPMTVVVNGDFTENGWSGTGYGILLVTGDFTYDENSSWDGIILVIGKGSFYVPDNVQNGGIINGAVFIAATEDSSGHPLASPGPIVYNYYHHNTYGNQGIFYSSCWVNYVQAPTHYQVLSFHEIATP